jgi:hypothetical protein
MAKKIIGRITMQFVQHTGGRWHCEVKQPRMYSKDLRATYKMALATAVLQDNINKTLHNIDRMIMNNEEIARYRDTQEAEGYDKPTPDTEKYQTNLPFEGKGPDHAT